MVTVASDNPYPSILMVETVDPSTPAAGTQRLFVDTDGNLKLIDDAAVVTDISSAAAAHIADTSDAHDASAVSFDDTGLSITAADVQTAIEELDGATSDLSGQELTYTQVTSPVNVTGTNEAGAQTIITGASVAYDGSTVVLIEVFAPFIQAPANANIVVFLIEDSTVVGLLGILTNGDAANLGRVPFHTAVRRTPSAASHTYVVKAYTTTGTAVVHGGVGGTGAYVPAFLRVTRV